MKRKKKIKNPKAININEATFTLLWKELRKFEIKVKGDFCKMSDFEQCLLINLLVLLSGKYDTKFLKEQCIYFLKEIKPRNG